MALALGGRDSSLKHRCQAWGNLRDELKDARHARRSKATLSSVYLNPLREKMVVLMLL